MINREFSSLKNIHGSLLHHLLFNFDLQSAIHCLNVCLGVGDKPSCVWFCSENQSVMSLFVITNNP